MVKAIFDLPDGNEDILIRAEAFLREKIEELGGELIRELEARGFDEYPHFEAQFPVIEPEDGNLTQDEEESGYALADLYYEIDALHRRYESAFGQYL